MGTPNKPSTGSGAAASATTCVVNCPAKKRYYLKVHVKSYFRIRHKDGTLTPSKKKKIKRRIGYLLGGVLDATVSITGTAATDRTSKARNRKRYSLAKLDITDVADGAYTLNVEPPASRKTTGPAGAALTGKAGKNAKDLTARKYRSIDVSIELKNKKAEKAGTTTAVNYANAWVTNGPSDTVYVDLKPDWWGGFSKKNSNRKPKGANGIDLIVLHNTGAVGDGDDKGSRSLAAAIGQGLKKYCGHYYVDLDGHIVKLYDDAKRVAAHAPGVNSRSVGIECVRPLNGFQELKAGNIAPLTFLQQAQYDSIKRLIQDLQSTYSIATHRVSGHCDANKLSCPGCDYWWDKLESEGLGMVLQEPPADTSSADSEYVKWFETKKKKHINGKADKVVRKKVIADLAAIGYKVSGHKWTSKVEKAIKSFRCHFYSGSRFYLRYPRKAKNKVKFPANTGKTYGGKPGPSGNNRVDYALARRIRSVADFMRKQTPTLKLYGKVGS